jgi:hypothetical protein
MSNAISGASGGGYASQIGTGPTKVEKQIAEKAEKVIKTVSNAISDTVKGVAKTPEGKAIVAGLMVAPFLPVVGPVIAFGGLASAALKHFSDAGKVAEGAAKAGAKAAQSVGKAGLVAGGAVAGAPLGPAGIALGVAAGLAASKAAEEVAKKNQ